MRSNKNKNSKDKRLIGRETSLTEKREKYVSLLSTSLAHAIDKLSKSDAVNRISLFGSYGRSKADLFTDLDILIIMDTHKPFLERTKEVYALLALPVDADILCYTPEEFGKLKKTPFFQKILAEEVILYEKEQH